MPLSKAHPLRDIHASHSRKLTISVRAIPKPLPASLSLPRSHFRLFSFSFVFFTSLLFSVPVTFDREATLSPARTFPRDEQPVPSSRIFVPFPIVGSPRDPVPVARISSIKRDVECESTKESACKVWKRLLNPLRFRK